MAGQAGSIVIADVTTGRILAAHNTALAAGRRAKPGSAIKSFVLLALLRSGRVRAEEVLACPRQLTIRGQHLDCSHPTGLAPLDADHALAYSCNHYFTQMATRLTPSQIPEVLRKYGLASGSDITDSSGARIVAEVVGSVQRTATMDEQRLQAIGEFGVEVTPLALLGAYRRLALEHDANPDDVSLAIVFQGMKAAVDFGMARSAKTDGWEIAGKTGTAASGSAQRTRGWFVGIAESEGVTQSPAVVILVYLEQGRGADAATIASRVLRAWRDKLQQPNIKSRLAR